MSTSRPSQPSRRGRITRSPLRLAFDAVLLTGVFAVAPEILSPSQAMEIAPHPGWIAVLVLGARDGGWGLIVGVFALACVVGIAATITSTSFAATWARIDSGENAVALGACLLVSWVGTWHQRRAADLDERRRTITARVSDAEATIATLRDVVARLRARADRTATSLSFLREAAS